MKVGDKVYSKIIGPETTGTITSIEINKKGHPMITIALDNPINKIKGYYNQFIVIDEK